MSRSHINNIKTRVYYMTPGATEVTVLVGYEGYVLRITHPHVEDMLVEIPLALLSKLDEASEIHASREIAEFVRATIHRHFEPQITANRHTGPQP